MKKKTLKKNPSNRKPISYSTEFRMDINLNNFVRKLCPAMINGEGRDGERRGGERRGGELKCYIHTYRQTYRASDEAGPRGAFATKNCMYFI